MFFIPNLTQQDIKMSTSPIFGDKKRKYKYFTKIVSEYIITSRQASPHFKMITMTASQVKSIIAALTQPFHHSQCLKFLVKIYIYIYYKGKPYKYIFTSS